MERIKAWMCNPGNYGDKELLGEWPCHPSKYLQWVTNEMPDIAIWIDCWESPCMTVLNEPIKYKVAVLVEPRVLAPHHYEFVLEHEEKFDLIFSTYQDFGKGNENQDKFRYFPGGARSLIESSDWKIYHKTKNICSIKSHKNYMPGHKLRHIISDRQDGMGLSDIEYSNPPMNRKVDGIKDYRFELVIENEDDCFFSEKILDSMLCGCIPIYWANTDLEYLSMFDMNGIVVFRDEDHLFELIQSGIFTEEFYSERIESVKKNFEIAQKYVSLGDMLWENGIRELLENGKQ